MPEETTPQAPDPASPPGDSDDSAPEESPSEEVLEIERLAALVTERDSEISGLKQQVELAVGRYRSALVAGAPDLPEELVQGSTIEELDRSVESARKIVEKVASRIEARAPGGRVPSGAPARRPADVSGLSAREKILYAINKS